MTSTIFTQRERGNWIRLRTLVFLRWWAILGQASALLVAVRLYSLQLELGFCILVLGIAAISNLAAFFIYPENKRLTQNETLLFVMFDMFQLGLMLYLTGGLNNPFSILIVGPVTVCAPALSSRSTVFLGIAAIGIVSLLTQFHLPLQTPSGTVLKIGDVFLFGNWIAIVIAVLFLGVYSRQIVSEMQSMSDALQATQMALERQQKLTDIGGVVAAAAHELGTPLATIKLTSAELAEELGGQSELKDDALLISQQADRCRDILRDMGQASQADPHMDHAPLGAILDEAAAPHLNRGKSVLFEWPDGQQQPIITRRSEIIHGLRNLIQNAVDFADEHVWIESQWSEEHISIRIVDDGVGYPLNLLGRLGDPFMRNRIEVTDPSRPEYEGMGLGLFIAKTLLERTDAKLRFTNGHLVPDKELNPERTGALVDVVWPSDRLLKDA